MARARFALSESQTVGSGQTGHTQMTGAIRQSGLEMALAGIHRFSSFGLSLAAAGLALNVALPGIAAAGDDFNQAEWAQPYDADAHLAVQRSSTPVLSQATFDATSAAISRYQSLVSSGGWPVVRTERVMRLGSEGD